MTHFIVSEGTAKVIARELSRDGIWYKSESLSNGEVKMFVKAGNPYAA
jgi:hypothetical protein